jgi:hypothetical protein
MFIYSVKASTLKFIGALLAAVCVLTLLVVFVPNYDSAYASSEGKITYSGVKTNEDRINFLKQFSWEVKSTVSEEVSVTIPRDFDAIFTAYNKLQEKQGFNLQKFKGKDVVRYTYEITNYPDYSGTVYANILVYKNKVIAADVCTADINGFVHGLSMEK